MSDSFCTRCNIDPCNFSLRRLREENSELRQRLARSEAYQLLIQELMAERIAGLKQGIIDALKQLHPTPTSWIAPYAIETLRIALHGLPSALEKSDGGKP